MLNYIWFALVGLSVIIGGVNGRLPEVTQAAFDMAKLGVEIAFGLIGVMALWLGLMRVAEKAGVIGWLVWLIRPIMKRLFPELPPDHPVMGSMLMNISASWLGLGNAATPLGLKAMEQLQELNPKKEEASNSQILFLAINTASITLIPTTIIAVRISAGSTSPLDIIGTTIFASGVATVVAIVASKLLARFFPGSGRKEV